MKLYALRHSMAKNLVLREINLLMKMNTPGRNFIGRGNHIEVFEIGKKVHFQAVV